MALNYIADENDADGTRQVGVHILHLPCTPLLARILAVKYLAASGGEGLEHALQGAPPALQVRRVAQAQPGGARRGRRLARRAR